MAEQDPLALFITLYIATAIVLKFYYFSRVDFMGDTLFIHSERSSLFTIVVLSIIPGTLIVHYLARIIARRLKASANNRRVCFDEIEQKYEWYSSNSDS